MPRQQPPFEQPPHAVAIGKWMRKHRPDVARDMERAFYSNDALGAMAQMCFEAGRDFQRANPNAEPLVLIQPTNSYNWDYE